MNCQKIKKEEKILSGKGRLLKKFISYDATLVINSSSSNEFFKAVTKLGVLHKDSRSNEFRTAICL